MTDWAKIEQWFEINFPEKMDNGTNIEDWIVHCVEYHENKSSERSEEIFDLKSENKKLLLDYNTIQVVLKRSEAKKRELEVEIEKLNDLIPSEGAVIARENRIRMPLQTEIKELKELLLKVLEEDRIVMEGAIKEWHSGTNSGLRRSLIKEIEEELENE